VHFTPTSASWLNLVEVWFGIIERQAIGRGTFHSVTDLNARSAHLSTAGTTAATRHLDKNVGSDPHESEPSDNFRNGPLDRAELAAVPVDSRSAVWSTC
jgi:hypothetical protein